MLAKLRLKLRRNNKQKMVWDRKHHYRWNYTFQMWVHTGMVHWREVPD